MFNPTNHSLIRCDINTRYAKSRLSYDGLKNNFFGNDLFKESDDRGSKAEKIERDL